MELKPCPFCGEEAESYYVITGSYACSCTSCSHASCAGFRTEQEAISAWNTRAENGLDKWDKEQLIKIGKAVMNKEPIHFLFGETYVPERTCTNTAQNKDDFCCSVCEAYAKGAMVDDFDCWVPVGKAFSKCPNCGARVEVS